MGIASIKWSRSGDGGGGGGKDQNPENTEVNNASRGGNERVLKFMLV